MDNKDELQELEFDLEDILKEFHVEPGQPEEAPEQEKMPEMAAPAEAPELEAVPMFEEAPAAPVLEMQPVMEAATEPEKAAEPAALHQTEAPEEADGAAEAALEADASEEAPEAAPAGEAEETLDADALLAEALKELEPEAAEDWEEATHRFEPQAAGQEEKQEAPAQPLPPITFTSPRSRLRELKKKLVAGPEKRYYVLSEAGIGKLQAAILVNVLIVLLCAGVATLYALDMVPENRFRLVIFSQVLAMLVSGLMGCQLMLDAIGGLFKGRFTVDTLLTVTFGVCIADSVFCLQEQRIPCCAAFCLSMTMALWARYERHTTEMAQMDTMRKAVRLHGITRKDDYYQGKAGFLRVEGEVEDFMDTYNKPSAPEKVQSAYALLSLLVCVGIAAFAGLRHGTGMAFQILSTSLLVAVPASFFVSISRPAAVLEQRLHMVGTVLCGWQGVKKLNTKAVFPLNDNDLFPRGCTKLNGVKFYGGREPDEVIAYTVSLINQTGGGLAPIFQQLLESRGGSLENVTSFRDYGGGGIGGIIRGEPVLLGDMAFLQDMGVEIPEGTMVSQAVYAAIDGTLCGVYAISYAKMRSASAGLVTLSGYRRLSPVMVGCDFMLTEEFIQSKFGVKPNRIAYPEPEVRRQLRNTAPDEDATVLAMTTRDELLSAAYAVTGARALSTATKLGVAIHMVGGILGMLMMVVLAILGSTELLTPINVLLYQLIWMVPGLLVTEWARTV